MRSGFLIVGLIAAAPLVAASSARAKEFHRVVPLAESGVVSVTSHNGTVSVEPWNQPSVGIDARIESNGNFDADPADVQKTEIAVDQSGSRVDIESDYSRVQTHSWLFGLGNSRSLPLVHYVIHMPAGGRLRVSVHNASVKVTGLTNRIDVETHNGNVNLAGIGGGAAVETHNGDVDIDFVRISAPSSIQTHNGEATVRVSADARLSLVADGHRRNPVSSDLPVVVRSASESDWNAALNGGGPELRFTTHNGSLRISRR